MSQTSSTSSVAIEDSHTYLGHLAAGRHAEAYAQQGATLALLMSPADLADLWRQMTALIGGFKAIEATEALPEGTDLAVFIRCAFERSALGCKLVWDEEHHLTSVQFYRTHQGYVPS